MEQGRIYNMILISDCIKAIIYIRYTFLTQIPQTKTILEAENIKRNSNIGFDANSK